MNNATSIPDLNARRKALKMPVATVVRRSGLSPVRLSIAFCRGKLQDISGADRFSA